MKDVIYRQAAIDAFDCSIGGIPVESVKYVSEYADKMMSRINALPPAHTEQRWIPVSEKLPEEGTYVLISKKPSPLSGKKWCVTIAGRFVDGRSRKIEWRDIGFGRMFDNDILAWCPLPEPYGGEQDE